MKKTISVLILFIIIQTAYSQNERSTDWDADLDYLGKELSEKHYNFFTVKSEDYLLSELDAIKKESTNLDAFQVGLKTQQLIAQFGDSHTKLSFEQFIDRNRLLPLQLFWFGDGLYVIRTTQENKEILGGKIELINNVPISTVIDSVSTLFAIDNLATVKSQVIQYIPSLQILEYFGFTKEGEVKLDFAGGKLCLMKPTVIDNNNVASFKPDSVSFCMKNQKAFFVDSYFSDEKIYYLQYNKCWSKESELEHGDKERAKGMPLFKDFEDKAFHVLNNQLVDKIIFDMRFNGGGNSAPGTAFIEKLAKYLKTHPSVKTYVVLGRNTFSSAILNAMDFKRLTNAIFVGEETAGKPNHFGEVRNFQLPNSKLYVGYSTKFFKNTDEDVNTIKPDVFIETSFSDFAKGIDPVYEWVRMQ